MGKLVGVFAVSHAPGQTGFPKVADKEKQEAVYTAWMELKRRLRDARPDILVVLLQGI
jgi:protocatechuate 4,5-dioxygenase beta chain/2,3-dihydroxyphenylpropionate 1,2-dioxygenase